MARRRAPGRTGCAWERERPAPPAHVVDAHSLYYEMRAELGWIGIALLLDRARGAARGGGVAALRGPGRHAYAAFLAAGDRAAASTRRSTGTGRCRRSSSGSSAPPGSSSRRPPRRAARAARAAPADARCSRASRACSLAVTPVTVAISQSRLNRERRRRFAQRRLRDRDRRRAGQPRRAARPGRGVRGAGLVRRARRPAAGWRSTAMRVAQRARPRQLAVRLRARGRPGARGRGPAAAPRRSRCGSTRSSRWPARSSAALRSNSPARRRASPRRAADPVRLTDERRAGARLSGINALIGCALSARRRCDAGARGPRSAARCRRAGPGSAAKPVNGRLESVLAPASTWRAGWTSRCRSRAGSPPPLLSSGRLPSPESCVAEDVAAAAPALLASARTARCWRCPA